MSRCLKWYKVLENKYEHVAPSHELAKLKHIPETLMSSSYKIARLT